MKRNFQVLPALFVVLFQLLHNADTLAQSVNLGNPPVLNFSKKEYKAGTQTWDVTQDKNGVMWFANNEGLLEFDGTHWRLYPLDNGTIVRSVQAGPDGKIYAGGQGDFGYFSPNDQGRLVYHSLKSLLPESERRFGDVWNIQALPEGVFFRTDNQLFRFDGRQITTLFPPGASLRFMGRWKGKLLVQDGNHLLYVFENGRLRRLGNPDAFEHGTISAVLAIHPDTILFTTIKDGIFFFDGHSFAPWKTQDDQFLKTNRIYCAGQLADGKIALGTSLNGLATLDGQRRIFHQVNKKSGLQNNTVLSLYAPRNGSLWLGLDNGIDFVDLHSPFSTLFPDGDLQGTGYSAQIFNGNIYFGTNTGLYATAWKSYYLPGERRSFSLVKNSEGQVWSLNELDGYLLAGHHEGAFEVQNLHARRLTNLQGIWKFVQMSPDIAVAGHYNGLALFRKTANGWTFEGPLEGLAESSRILAKDNQGYIWMAHPYRGIYRIRVHPAERNVEAEFFNDRQGLPSDMGNHLFQLGEKIVYTGEKGVFDFDAAKGRFVPNQTFNQLFGEKTRVKYLRQDDAGNIWYVTGEETGVLLVESGALEKKVRKVAIPELKEKLIGGFQFLLPVNAQNVFVATGQGFILFNLAAYTSGDSTIRLVMHEIRLKGNTDSLLYGGHASGQALAGAIVVPSNRNTLHFAFSATDYPGGEYIRYAHFLEGAERGWSDWDTKPDLTFNNLNPGDYTLRIKAVNQHGLESAELTWSFKILPPWYASRLAYFFYFILLLGLVAGIIYRQQKRFEQEKIELQTLHKHREEQHRLHARRSEEAINRLQNEKLEAEVNHKNQELASATLHLVQKSEILNTIKVALERLKRKTPASSDLGKEIERIIRIVDHDASIDADWEQFSYNFDQVHSDFLKRLSSHYAHLSPNDYKLCAYLRMNLSSKEIASLMNISVRGVEASRYRLRKRLGLDTETNLSEFLIQF